MPTGTTVTGKRQLFKVGWTTPINHIRLFTTSGSFVDGRSATFTYNSGDQTIGLSADVIFKVSAGISNISYVEIGNLTSGTFVAYYKKDLPATYNFTIAGTLTVDSFVISMTNAYVTAYGKQKLWEIGWESLISKAVLLTDSNAEIDTVTGVSFTAVDSGLALNGTIQFEVATPVSLVNKIMLKGSVDADSIYTRTFGSYNFPTYGTFEVGSWLIA